MSRAFDPLEKITNTVQAQSGVELAEVSRDHAKRPAPCGRSRRSQSAAERLIHGFPERPVRLSRLRAQLRGHILVEGQGCAHIKMLNHTHHDVNLPSEALPGRIRERQFERHGLARQNVSAV